MNAPISITPNTLRRYDSKDRYARCITVSKRINWDIDNDVIRGRRFDTEDKFLPDGLSQVDRLDFMEEAHRRFLSQIQGRTYANIFGLAERFVNAKVLEISQNHVYGDQIALEALMRFSSEELKHQEMFRRVEALTAETMPDGYRFTAEPNAFARVIMTKSTWAVLALTCHIELFTQQHYKQSIATGDGLSPLYKDIFLYHWKEESQHAILDELEWRAEDERIDAKARDQAVDDLIALVVEIDKVLQAQAAADFDYFIAHSRQLYSGDQQHVVRDAVLAAYRWQYVVSGVQGTRFVQILGEMISDGQMRRVTTALAPLTG
jgi:hypothetical protein